MNPIALGVFENALPFIQERVHSKDMVVYHTGGKAHGYPESTERYAVRVVHSNTLMTRWEMFYPASVDVKFEVHAVPMRKVMSNFVQGDQMQKLIPLGEQTFTSRGKVEQLLLHYTNSAEYAAALKAKETFNTTRFARTQDVGYFYRHVHAHLVALQTAAEGITGVGKGTKLMELAQTYSPSLFKALAVLQSNPPTDFDEAIPRYVEILQAEGIEVIPRYDR